MGWWVGLVSQIGFKKSAVGKKEKTLGRSACRFICCPIVTYFLCPCSLFKMVCFVCLFVVCLVGLQGRPAIATNATICNVPLVCSMLKSNNFCEESLETAPT